MHPGVAKAAMEKQVQLASKQYGINYAIIRASSWFGPGTLHSPPAASPLAALIMQVGRSVGRYSTVSSVYRYGISRR
jgi:nucleoside-diphosphate-sugar epimerase